MINLMGIEFEGGWDGTRGISPFTDADIKHDGSLNPGSMNTTHVGELVSPALPPEELVEWAVGHIPSKVNKSCGTHVHFSFKDQMRGYAACMSLRFMRELYKTLEEYISREDVQLRDPKFCTDLRDRLNGKNTYCRKKFDGMSQVTDVSRSSTRYAGVNYCYSLHRTMEIRILPGVSNERTLREVLDLIITLVQHYSSKRLVKNRIRFRR